VRWETFYTFGEATSYGEDESTAAVSAATAACCGAPAPKAAAPACC
jgi:hypothetical protein